MQDKQAAGLLPSEPILKKMDNDCRASAWSPVVPEETFLDEGAASFFPEIYASSILAFIHSYKRQDAWQLYLACIFQNMCQPSDKHGEAPCAILRLLLQWVHVKLKPPKSTQALQTGFAASAIMNN